MTTKQFKLLDLFSGAGGAAKGYQQAGFHVTGIDNRPMPRYAGDVFIQADALEYAAEHGHEFDAIHASPPCQGYSRTKMLHSNSYPDLIGRTRKLLSVTNLPYVIENVRAAPLRACTMLCGTAFDLGTDDAELRRHRYFETNWSLRPPDWSCRHDLIARQFPAATNRKPNSRRTVEVGVWRIPLETQKRAMGVDWDMTLEELSEAIPPAYTELIGAQLLQHIRAATA